MKLKILLLFFISLFFFNPCFSLDEKKVVRVAISNTSFSTWDYQNIKITSDNIISIVNLANNYPIDNIEANKTVEFRMENNLFNIYVDNELYHQNLAGPLLLSTNSKLQIIGLNRKGTPAKYEGMLELSLSKKMQNRFNIINVVDMKNYLRGVVPNEMPISFGLEALKAQAVAARNYVQNAKISSNYDVVDSTQSQVYYGLNSYREISDSAIEQTSGVYALYKDKPISALYFSTSPGITDDWDEVFANNNNIGSHPYLKSRIDKVGQKPLESEKDVIDFYSRKDNGLDVNSPKFRWSVEFTRKELEQILHTTLQQQSKLGLVSPKYDGDIELVGLKEIKPLKRTKSGKITELKIIAKNGEYVVKKESAIRRVLKKNSQMLSSSNFFVTTSGKENLETSNNIQPNNNFIENLETKLFDAIDYDTYPSTFKLTGGGFGHNVGMSQFGAYNLAKIGKKYPDILNHYYSGIYLSTLPKTVLYNNYNVWYKSEFYFDKSNFRYAYLFIDNQKEVSEFPFKINDTEFYSTNEIAQNKMIKINITQYLNNGKNIVNFAPLNLNNKGKFIIYKIEFIQ